MRTANSALWVPIPDEALAKQYDIFVTQYGKDNAEYLIETLGNWQRRYKRAAFIDMGVLTPDGYKAKLENDSERFDWAFEMLNGDLKILSGLLNGEWAKKEHKNYIVIPPGSTVDITYDKQVFRCTPG